MVVVAGFSVYILHRLLTAKSKRYSPLDPEGEMEERKTTTAIVDDRTEPEHGQSRQSCTKEELALESIEPFGLLSIPFVATVGREQSRVTLWEEDRASTGTDDGDDRDVMRAMLRSVPNRPAAAPAKAPPKDPFWDTVFKGIH